MEGTGQIKVLAIDDDFEMTEMLRIILESENFEVFTTTHSPSGVELARSKKPDLIILDLLMPELDGWQVCEEIRKFSQVPILILSAVSKPGMAVRALDAGADDYLLKPLTSSVLVAHLRKMARRIRPIRDTSEANLSIGAA